MALRCFTGHGGLVLSVAVSPDGHQLVSGSSDGTLRLWDIETGREVRRFQRPKGVSVMAIFSPDSRRVLSGGAEDTVRLWDAATGRELRSFRGGNGEIYTLAFTPDGRRVLSAGVDSSVVVWDVHSGGELCRFTGHECPVNSLAVSPDGRLALSAAGQDAGRVWEIETGRQVRVVTPFAWGLNVAFCPAGPRLLAWDADRFAQVIDLQTRAVLHRFRLDDDGALPTLSPDGRRLLSGGYSKTLRLWDVGTGRVRRTFEGHTDAITCMAFCPDGRRAVSGSTDRTVRLWALPP